MDYGALENQALAQGKAAAAQGQQMLSSDQSNASNYQNQYNSATAQASQQNQDLQNYTNYMQNAGNPLNLYNQGISQAEQSQGFDPKSLAAATQNLTQVQNQLQNVNNAANSSTGGYGLSGSQLGAYYGSLSQPLQQAASAQNTSVGNLQQLYQNALTQGQQGATLGFQGEQQVSSNLNQVYQNTLAQANQYLQQMQFYSQLASTQGGLNAQQQATYNSIAQGYAQTKATVDQMEAAASYNAAQTAQQNMQNAMTQSYMGSNAYKNYLNYGSTTAPKTSAPSSKSSAPASKPKMTPQQIAKTNGVDLNSLNSDPAWQHPDLLTQLFGSGGHKVINDIGSWF